MYEGWGWKAVLCKDGVQGSDQRSRCMCEARGDHEFLLQDLFPHSGSESGGFRGLPWQTLQG